MSPETKEYVETWTKRIESISGDNLNEIFERFSALYTLHNRLYNESFRLLNDAGKLTKDRYADHEKASDSILEYLTAEKIIECLRVNDNFKDIESIAKLIQNDIFYINLADGVPKKEFDMALMKNLRSNDYVVKARAILRTIYNVRGNMLHGEKHFEEHQRLLLEPLIRILKSLINLQIEEQK